MDFQRHVIDICKEIIQVSLLTRRVYPPYFIHHLSYRNRSSNRRSRSGRPLHFRLKSTTLGVRNLTKSENWTSCCRRRDYYSNGNAQGFSYQKRFIPCQLFRPQINGDERMRSITWSFIREDSLKFNSHGSLTIFAREKTPLGAADCPSLSFEHFIEYLLSRSWISSNAVRTFMWISDWCTYVYRNSL